jgi:DeoR/GlpR family transcriptional regulator of sugar metabolism
MIDRRKNERDLIDTLSVVNFMFAQERLRAISKVVRERSRMTFAELQAVIPASPAAIRMDLGKLERSGELIRVHGGVMDIRYARSEITFGEPRLAMFPRNAQSPSMRPV